MGMYQSFTVWSGVIVSWKRLDEIKVKVDWGDMTEVSANSYLDEESLPEWLSHTSFEPEELYLGDKNGYHLIGELLLRDDFPMAGRIVCPGVIEVNKPRHTNELRQFLDSLGIQDEIKTYAVAQH